MYIVLNAGETSSPVGISTWIPPTTDSKCMDPSDWGAQSSGWAQVWANGSYEHIGGANPYIDSHKTTTDILKAIWWSCGRDKGGEEFSEPVCFAMIQGINIFRSFNMFSEEDSMIREHGKDHPTIFWATTIPINAVMLQCCTTNEEKVTWARWKRVPWELHEQGRGHQIT